jgi:hypothetical protein
LVWIILIWQAALALLAITWWLTRRAVDQDNPSPAPEAAPEGPTPPERDAPGLRTLARFALVKDPGAAHLDAEALVASNMADFISRRLRSISAQLDEQGTWADEEEAKLRFSYRDTSYSIDLVICALDNFGELVVHHHTQDDLTVAPPDTFATRELLVELHRILRHAEVCQLRWYPREFHFFEAYGDEDNAPSWHSTPI